MNALAIHAIVVVPMHRREESAEEFKEKVESQSDILVEPFWLKERN